MSTYTELDEKSTHDFRPHKLRWGWNGLRFEKMSKTTAKMTGIGKGIEEGHYIILRQGETDFGYLVQEIQYESNPSDYFIAELKIIGTYEE